MLSFERRTLARTIFGVLVIVLVGILARVNQHYQRDALELVNAANRTNALITHKNCSNAGLVDYAFTVDGKQYRGSSNACVASCGKAQIGESVPITYSVKNPANSICGSAEKIAARFNSNYYALLFITFGLFAVILRMTRRP